MSLFDRFIPALLLALFFDPAASATFAATRPPPAENSDAVCARCHQAMIKLSTLLPFHFGFRCPACTFQSGGEASMSFEIRRVARNRFLVALDRVWDLVLQQKRAAG
jgi:hypothetical protein